MTTLDEEKEMKDFQEALSEFQNLIPMLNGKTIKEEANISDEELLNLHAIACGFFEKGKLDDSELFFRHLCLLDCQNMDYILGLAAVLQRKKSYPAAIDAYAAAHMLQKNDSRPMFYAGQCFFFERKYAKAKYCFEIVIEDNHSSELTQMAALFIDAINKGKKND